MELATIEWPEGVRVMPGRGGANTFLVRFRNGFGASLIRDLRGNGLELGVIRFERDDSDEDWEFVYGTSVNPYDALVPGVDTPEELLWYVTEIAGWDKPREEFTEGEFRFVWVSAAYIDVHWAGYEDVPPFTCIGIYDYAAGECKVTGRDGFVAKCRAWIAEATAEYEDGGSEAETYRVHTLDPYV